MTTEVTGTDGKPEVTQDEGKEALEALRAELEQVKTDAEETSRTYETRIGGLISANGTRQKDADEREERLTERLSEMERWQTDVTVQSLEPAEQEAFTNNKLQKRIDAMEADRRAEKKAVEDARAIESQRQAEYTRAVALGVPIEKIDFNSTETISASIKNWEEQGQGRELNEVRSELAKLQKDLKETREAAGQLVRSTDGDTTVVSDVSAAAGAEAGVPADEYEGMDAGAKALIEETKQLIGKKGKGGMIISAQRRLAEEFGLEVDFRV